MLLLPVSSVWAEGCPLRTIPLPPAQTVPRAARGLNIFPLKAAAVIDVLPSSSAGESGAGPAWQLGVLPSHLVAHP